jgi:hypothetical protein
VNPFVKPQVGDATDAELHQIRDAVVILTKWLGSRMVAWDSNFIGIGEQDEVEQCDKKAVCMFL